MTEGPDAAEARQRYDRMASEYDQRLGFQGGRLGRYQEGVRKRAIGELRLEPGQTVIDVGCGTGASFARLTRAVGNAGRVIGVDQSSGMLEVASTRVATERWSNVELIESRVEAAELPAADAALFFFTHDLLRTPAALDNVVGALHANGRAATAGGRRPTWWAAPVAITAHIVMRRYATTAEGLARPWDLLADRLTDVAATSLLLGTIYVVGGCRPAT
jgi:ubiquinone/menaquinone biosynthesis C-methylase UbiE